MLPPSDATRTDGLVCVGDRGAELRNIDPFHEGVLEDEDAAPVVDARCAPGRRSRPTRRRPPVPPRARHRKRLLPGIFVFENPPFLARARVATASIPDASPLESSAGTVAAVRVSRALFTPFTASVSFARPRARAPISPPPPSPDRSSSALARPSITRERFSRLASVARRVQKLFDSSRAPSIEPFARARPPPARRRATTRLARSTRLFSRHPSRHASPSRRRRRRRTRRRRARRRARARRAANHRQARDRRARARRRARCGRDDDDDDDE